MSALDSLTPVSFSWEVDQTRSTIPLISNTDSGAVGSFVGQTNKVWEWRRPDTGFALILSLSYRLETGQDSVGGRLIRYCP